MPRHALSALFALALVSTVSAQAPCYGENTGNVFNPAVSMGGAWVGVKFVAPASGLNVTRIEVMTGNATGSNSVSLWTHDAIGNRPLANQGTGTWAVASVVSWQGANLPSPVALAGLATYWLVWAPSNGAQCSVDLPGSTVITQQYRGSFDNGQTWNGPFTFADRPWKFRFNCVSAVSPYQVNQSCATLDVGGVTTNGATPAVLTASVGVPFPVIFNGLVGNPFDVVTTVGATLIPSAFTTISGQVVNINLAHPSVSFLLGATFTAPLNFQAFGVVIPSAATEIDAQMVVIDPAHPEGYCLSQASAARTL